MKTLANIFYRLRTGFVKIDEVSSIKRLGRDEYQYCENKRCVKLQIEMLTGPINRLIYASTIKMWEPPHEMEPISLQEKMRIAEIVKRHFEAGGIKTVIEE